MGQGAEVEPDFELKSPLIVCSVSAKGHFKVQTGNALITLSTCISDTMHFYILDVISTTFLSVFFKSTGCLSHCSTNTD